MNSFSDWHTRLLNWFHSIWFAVIQSDQLKLSCVRFDCFCFDCLSFEMFLIRCSIVLSLWFCHLVNAFGIRNSDSVIQFILLFSLDAIQSSNVIIFFVLFLSFQQETTGKNVSANTIDAWFMYENDNRHWGFVCANPLIFISNYVND